MGWKQNALELVTRLCGTLVSHPAQPPVNPQSIFVLRNNDIGDLLVITPLFEALKKRFPAAKIIAGVGEWNFDVLKNNPYVDEVLPINAPWHNQRARPQGLLPALRYIAASDEVRNLRQRRCDIGIDVLGSPFGSWLLMRAGIPFRLGVKGYAGGHTAASRCVIYDDREPVGRAALRFAELLGATDLPATTPQLHLESQPPDTGAIVIAPGGGFAEKCWPLENYVELARLLSGRKIIIIGGEGDTPAAAKIAQANPMAENLAGKLSLRETLRVIASASLIICNSSMAMHAAAAFGKRCIVVLGPWYPSAGAHAAQWGHPGVKILGRETESDAIASPDTVMELISAP